MIEYQRLNKRDFDEMVFYYETFLNKGKFIREQIKSELISKNFLGIKAVDNGKTVGLCFGKDALELTYPHPSLEQKIRKIIGQKKIHCVDAMAIDEAYRGQNISTEMIKKYKESLIKKGYDLIFVEVWVYPDGRMPVDRTMRHFGKPVWELLKKRYYKDISKYGITCPMCGENCVCGAKLTLYDLEKEESQDGATD